METDLTSLEDQLAAATAARDGALRELDSLRARVASADAIHKRSNQRESELQKTIDALAAAELNLKAARTAESQALARATAAEAALARSGGSVPQETDLLPALEKQLGESRRLESAATAEAADLRAKLADARAQVTAVASDTALAAVRESASKAQAELHAVLAQNGALRRELDNSRARIAQLEAAAVTIQSQKSVPSPELREARSAADKARHALRSAEGTLEKLRRDLATAHTRITGLESTLAATRAASAANISAGTELAAARKMAENLRSDLLAISEENRRLKKDLTPRPPRPRREDTPPSAAAPATPPASESPEALAPTVEGPATSTPSPQEVASPTPSNPE
jgi:chromosome segregation ATPase